MPWSMVMKRYSVEGRTVLHSRHLSGGSRTLVVRGLLAWSQLSIPMTVTR